jgi:hypothetical protein
VQVQEQNSTDSEVVTVQRARFLARPLSSTYITYMKYPAEKACLLQPNSVQVSSKSTCSLFIPRGTNRNNPGQLAGFASERNAVELRNKVTLYRNRYVPLCADRGCNLAPAEKPTACEMMPEVACAWLQRTAEQHTRITW